LSSSAVPVSTSTYQVGNPIKVARNLPATMAVTPDGKTLYPGDWYTVSCSWIRERL
jgi:DNA-binding beta-propeller fold protein YncE